MTVHYENLKHEGENKREKKQMGEKGEKKTRGRKNIWILVGIAYWASSTCLSSFLHHAVGDEIRSSRKTVCAKRQSAGL